MFPIIQKQINKEHESFEKENVWLINRDIINYYPSCGTEMCLIAVGQLLDFRSQNFPDKQRTLDALAITMTSDTFNFMGRHFMQIDFFLYPRHMK